MMNKVFTKMHAVGVVALIVASPWVVAMEVLLESELKVYAQHDNNISLAVDDETSLYGEVVNPNAKLTMRSEAWSSQINADLRFAEYNRDGYESDDQYLTFLTKRKGERSEFSLTANAVHDTTRTSEELDSGRFSNERHELYSIGPIWTYFVTDKNLFTLQTVYTKNEYDDSRYTGQDYGQVSAKWTYVIDEQLRLFLQANASKTEFDEQTLVRRFVGEDMSANRIAANFAQVLEQQSSTFGAQIGGEYQWNEKLNIYGLFGRDNAKIEYDVDSPPGVCEYQLWYVGYRGLCDITDSSTRTKNTKTGATWKEERQTFSLNYSITIKPSSDGRVLEYEVVGLSWRYQLTETGMVNFSMVWGENREIDQPDNVLQVGNSNREFITATTAYSHRLTENWYINASLQYRYQQREFFNDEAEGLGGTIGISYFFDKKQW